MNYGDYVIVFLNPLADFMIKEAEQNIEFLRLLERRNKRQADVQGKISEAELKANRLDDDKFEAAQLIRIETAEKKVMESLGYSYEGNYEDLLKGL